MATIPMHHSNIVTFIPGHSCPVLSICSFQLLNFNVQVDMCLAQDKCLLAPFNCTMGMCNVYRRDRTLVVAGEINKSVQKQNGQKRRRGRELERGEEKEKELDGLEEGEGRERERKLLAKKKTRAFAGTRDKKGQGGLLTRRDRKRTRTTVYGEREGERYREKTRDIV